MPANYDDLTNDSTRDTLNAMSTPQVIAVLGSPQERVTYASVPVWNVGDERPDLADDDPAVMQAIGRCATSRRTNLKGVSFLVTTQAHPKPCGWCGYPTDELLKACSWAVHQSGYVEAHVFIWADSEGRTYHRTAEGTTYRNVKHRSFWELPASERLRRVEAVIADSMSVFEGREAQ